jgi:hypothetical protein
MGQFERKCPFSRERCMGQECELSLKSMCCFRSIAINAGNIERTVTDTLGPRAEGAIGLLQSIVKAFESEE